ncbi:MAG: GFA family protein [Sphingomonas sp.]|nr:GFA family protein [Sphingomonas sp.]
MSVQALVGSCHCGRVTITLPRPPDDITQCNCSLCTKTGFQGIYYASDVLRIEGETDSYVRVDSDPAFLATHRCRHCGILTHWVPLTDPPHERMGVNARLFEPGTFKGVPVKQVDGRSWPA